MKDRENVRDRSIIAQDAIRNSINAIAASRVRAAQRLNLVRKAKPGSDSYTDQAPLGMVIIGEDGSFEYVNPKFTQMFGYAPDEVPNGKEWFKKAYPDARYRREAISRWVNLTTESSDGEIAAQIFRVRCKDGTWKSIHFRPVQLETGQYLMTCEDITELSKTTDALRLEKAKFQGLAENLPLGVVMIARNGCYEYVNPKFSEMFGYDLKEVPNGKEWFKRAFPDRRYRAEAISLWKEGQKPGEQRPRTFTVRCKNGAEKAINFRPVQLGSGEHLVTCEDVTKCALKVIYGISVEE
jgi:PAS domain S-box-containing protein